jgi:hypothetical protein
MREHHPPRHLRLEQSPLERARLWVEIAAFLAAGCWAVYTFIYQTRIAPLFVPSHEMASISAQRLSETPSNYLERVEVTIRNDGTVDVDTAALAIAVLGAEAGKDLKLRSKTATAETVYREIPASSWTAVGGYGMLFAGATAGHRGQHLILRPGDSVPLDRLVVVPRKYRVLAVQFQTIYDRYPISRLVDVKIQNREGVVTLKSKPTTGGFGVNFDAYFAV